MIKIQFPCILLRASVHLSEYICIGLKFKVKHRMQNYNRKINFKLLQSQQKNLALCIYPLYSDCEIWVQPLNGLRCETASI